jgi:8-oxo-dGTP pyrophosphatase MutT (NUDIX family)
MVEVTRHFTATTFVVHDGRVLLHKHRRQGLWLPPGGHIERDELPDDAARREIEEETGLRLHLHSEVQAAHLSRAMDCGVVPQPAFILIEDINPYHQHIDFTYFARLSDGAVAANLSGAGERNEFAWFAPDELDMEGVPQNVREGAMRAIAHFRGAGAAKNCSDGKR